MPYYKELAHRTYSNSLDDEYWIKIHDECVAFMRGNNPQEEKDYLRFKSCMEAVAIRYDGICYERGWGQYASEEQKEFAVAV